MDSTGAAGPSNDVEPGHPVPADIAPLAPRLRSIDRAWPVWTAVMGVVFAVGQVVQWPSVGGACRPDGSCLRYQLSDSTAERLARLGIERGVYAAVVLVAAIGAAVGLFALAYFVRGRADRELLPTAFSWVLPAAGATFYLRQEIVGELGPLLPIAAVAFLVNYGALVPFLVTFPTGRCFPRWTRWVAFAWPLINAADFVDTVRRSAGHPLLPGPAYDAVGVLLIGSLVVGLGAQIFRYRRVADAQQRRQTGWVLASLGLLVAQPIGIIGFALLTGSAIGSPSDYGKVGFLVIDLTSGLVSTVAFAAIAVALVRFRLWGVEVVLNRLLVWGTLSAGVLGAYLLAVVAFSGALGVHDSGLPAVSVAGAVAFGLRPARDRVQRFADRAVWGKRDVPDEIASEMSHLDADLDDVSGVLSRLADLVALNLRLPAVRIDVELHDRTVATGRHGHGPERPAWSTPLRANGIIIGELCADARIGQRRLSSQDRHALALVARQAAVTAAMLRHDHEREELRRHLGVARDEERHRLRRDLHDGLGPTLASITQRIEAARSPAAGPARRENLLAGASEGLHDAIGELRRIVNALRPLQLDELGLLRALRRSIERSGATNVVLECDADVPDLPADKELAVYRVAEEAILNAERHAAAQRITVTIRHDDGELLLEVRDDGLGIAATSAAGGERRDGIGLASMRDRMDNIGGRLIIASPPEGGTVLQARLPWRGGA